MNGCLVKTLFNLLVLSIVAIVSLTALSEENDNKLCESNSCLLSTVGKYEYCSLAPHNFRGNDLFRSQSFLTISSEGKEVTLETAIGVYALKSTKGVEHKKYPEDEFSLAKELRQTRLISPHGFNANYLFQGPILTDPKKQQVHLSDMKLFLDHGYALQLSVSNGGEVFPGMKDDVINYTPCTSLVQGTDEFHFTFEDESKLKLTVRVADGASGHGYYVGFLLSAIGEYQGFMVNISDAQNLSMLGSTRSWSEVTIPTMVVKWPEHKGTCGIIFDKTKWYAEDSVSGYHAYSRDCNGDRGGELALTSATYSRRYKLP